MAAKLIVTLDGQLIKEIELDKSRVLIGRKPSNDIQIDNLAVSGEHAAVTTILDDSFVEDLGSTNGTQVNHQPITRHVLQHGDEIEIGKYCIKYANPQAIGGRKESPDSEKTVIRNPGATQAMPAVVGGDISAITMSLVTPAAAKAEPLNDEQGEAPSVQIDQNPPAAEPRPVIQILNGPNAGKELELVKTLTSLGKPGVQVAVITRRPQGCFLTHVQGDRHPAVNGDEVGVHPHLLADHDVIEIGGIKMEFYLK